MFSDNERVDEPIGQLIGCGRSSAEEIRATIRRDLDAHCRSATKADDVTSLVVDVSEGQTRAPGSSSEATPAEARKVSTENIQADLDAIARMMSEGCPNA